MKKDLEAITIEDLRKHPVWRFTNNDNAEFELETVQDEPLGRLAGLIVGTEVILAELKNGQYSKI